VLDVCVFSPRTSADALRIMWRLWRKDFRPDPCMLYLPGRAIRVECDPPRLAQADGELIGRTPFDVEVEPRAAHLLAPQSRR
jgi:diacylglycerol kinase (ATP)